MTCSADLEIVRLILDALDPAGTLISEAPALLGDPTPEEEARFATPAARRGAFLEMFAKLESLSAAMLAVEERAIDSGVVDDAFPLSHAAREAQQLELARDGVLGLLRTARALCLLSSRIQGALPPHLLEAMRAVERDTLRDADAEYARTLARGAMPLRPGEHETGSALLSELFDPEATEAMHGTSYEEDKFMLLSQMDRATPGIPRKRLPQPLATGAPSPALADVARLLDENGSLSSEDRAYMLSGYLDVMEKRSERYQAVTDTEKKAWIDPQPLFSHYDPALAKEQDRFLDAARGAGSFSSKSGRPIEDERMPPALTGGLDVDPTHETALTAKEEAAAVLRGFEARGREDEAKLLAGVTESIERAMGMAPRLSRAMQAAQGRGDGSGGARTFFERRAAGEAMHSLPQPPATGHRVILEPKRRAAAEAAPEAKGKKKKK